jgi:hypothetical protein
MCFSFAKLPSFLSLARGTFIIWGGVMMVYETATSYTKHFVNNVIYPS